MESHSCRCLARLTLVQPAATLIIAYGVNNVTALDRYFVHPFNPDLRMRAVIEYRDDDGFAAASTYEWNADLPVEVQRELVAQWMQRAIEPAP